MPEESQALDPYEVVLADLRAKRDQIDSAIRAIEDVRGGTATSRSAAPASAAPVSHGPGAFLGMTIVDATKVLLATKRQPMNNSDITAALASGGLALTSADPINTVGSVLTRRFNNVGDIVRIGRGTWGLMEWYPNRNFKKRPSKGDAESHAPGEIVTQGEVHAVASELISNVRAARALTLDDDPSPWAPIDQPLGRSEAED